MTREGVCGVHLMGPCPCRACEGRGESLVLVWGLIDCDVEAAECSRCGGDGCDPEAREDCEPEGDDDAAP